MPKIIMTRNDLYQIDQQIIQLKKSNQALALLLSNRIEQFYIRAALPLNIMRGRFKDIQEKYVQKDDRGNFIVTGEGQNAKWKFIQSKTDLVNARVLDVSMVEEEFNKEVHAFMKQTITLDW